MARIAVVTRL